MQKTGEGKVKGEGEKLSYSIPYAHYEYGGEIARIVHPDVHAFNMPSPQTRND